ncbi:hypothetical protein [Mesorhizobium amorphae]|uniref:Uncharacterized protein n=1 Tax=Mesorhizobium amorphae CCNWGS0123 TaxID=1082933 RepID=G6Y6K0_9HYPH|nr:hypothetical protein [Mesorhizobium amorphae]ANT49958.1 hypothetical protein A6B35_08440 [Mesorhizobium amorphae CCNWGS0123]EHH12690.1 hypothetical protein MEA186_07824 [Mesorhizobium amorphae CCNWGS0123]GLR39880.1 hypothetical protein GCM10007880_03960 [Mesorhizobium amorphae]
MFVVFRVLGLAALSAFGTTHADGSTIVPMGVVYSNRTEETEEARVCEIILDVSNPPSRELVKFITLGGYTKADGAVLAGFLMGVADIVAVERADIVQITDATFNAATFSSLGQLNYETYDDGTVMATTENAEFAAPFINAVLAGNYELGFSRLESGAGMRTYKILPAPSEAVASNFIRCMDDLAMESQQVRSSVSTKRSPLPAGNGNRPGITMDQGGRPIVHPGQGRTWATHK